MSQNTNKPLSDNSTWQAIGAYAEAKQEIERLTAENERIAVELEQRCRELNLSLGQQAVQLRQIGELTAENERLRKAGDAVIIAYQTLIVEHPDLLRAINVAKGDWNAAKEGRDAK